MRTQIVSKSGRLYSAVGLAALSALLPARAANLLVNAGFESPTDLAGTTSSTCSGWTFKADCQRASFHNNTAGGRWSIWEKTFEPAGGGVTQNVSATAGSMYNLTVQQWFEPNFATSGATSQLGLIWLDGSNTPVGTANYTNIPATAAPPTNVWTPYSVSGTAPAGATQVQVFLGWTDGTPGAQQISAFFDDADLEGAGTPPANQWILNGSGDWNIGTNWANGTTPTGAGVEADLFGIITSDHTVFSDTAITLGFLNFNNSHTYVVAGAGSLTLQSVTGNAQVRVQHGTQKLNLPTFINSNTDLNVDNVAGAALIVADPMTVSAGKVLTQNGNVTFQAPLTFQTSAAMVVASGSAALWGAPGITPGSGAKLDLKNNSATIDYHGLNASATVGAVKAQLVSGYANGAWTGEGIDTSSSTSRIGLGWKDDPTNQRVVVKYAYYGDADLSGTVDTLDFSALAGHFGATGEVWNHGDFNYDGTVDTVDFNYLAGNFGQTLPANQPIGAAGALVPEPASFGVIALVMVGMVSRRRRLN